MKIPATQFCLICYAVCYASVFLRILRYKSCTVWMLNTLKQGKIFRAILIKYFMNSIIFHFRDVEVAGSNPVISTKIGDSLLAIPYFA